MYQYYNPHLQQMQPIQMPQSLISVRSEMDAKNYPVAPGNSVIFHDETAPYIYTKTMGMSQLDHPTFEKFRLVREGETTKDDAINTQITSIVTDIGGINDAIKVLNDAVKASNEQIEALKKKVNKPKRVVQEIEEDD